MNMRKVPKHIKSDMDVLNSGGLVLKDDVIADNVEEWLNSHPEATTTVQDGSLTLDKFGNGLKLKTVKDYITPQMFGAYGDGIHDDTLAVQNSIDYACDNGNTLFIPSGQYYISDTLSIHSTIKIVGENKHTSIFIAGGSLLEYQINTGTFTKSSPLIEVSAKQTKLTTTLGINHSGEYLCKEGDRYLTVDNSSLIKKDDIIKTKARFDGYPWTADNRGYLTYGETNIVNRVENNIIYLLSSVAYTYPIPQTSDSKWTIDVSVVEPIKNLVIDNIQLLVESQIPGKNKYNYYYGLMIHDCLNAVISNVIVRGFGGIGIESSSSYHTLIKNCKAEDCWTLTDAYKENPDTHEMEWMDDVWGSAGYGLRFVQDRNSIISYCESINGKHCFDASGNYPAYGCIVENSLFEQNTDLLKYGCVVNHGTCDRIIIRNNVVNCLYGRGIALSSERATIVGNRVYGGIYLVSGGSHTIKDNEIINSGVNLYRPEVNDENRYTIVTGNIVSGSVNSIIALYATGNLIQDTVYGLIITNNILISNSSTIYLINLGLSGVDHTSFQKGLVIKDNIYRSMVSNLISRLDFIGATGKTFSIGSSLYDAFIIDELCTRNVPNNDVKIPVGSCRYDLYNHRPLWYDGTTWKLSDGSTP